MTNEYWFRPRDYGSGVYPAHWKGWAAIVGALALLTCALFAVTVLGADRNWALVAIVASMVGFFPLMLAKTEGGWAFRWKGKKRKFW